jgi:hypothetical protein
VVVVVVSPIINNKGQLINMWEKEETEKDRNMRREGES